MVTSSRFDNIPLDESKGQVWTPDHIGKQMVDLVSGYFDRAISILDPASGPGTFMALVNESQIMVDSFTSIEVDPLLHRIAGRSAKECRFLTSLMNADFLTENLTLPLFDAVILNPPYIRHEKINPDVKHRLATQFSSKTNLKLSQQTNLYGYFLLQSLEFLKPGGVMCAIIYDSLCATRYGNLLENALSQLGEFVFRKKVNSPFHNRLIDAEIIVMTKREEPYFGNFRPTNAVATLPNGFCNLSALARVARGTSFVKRSYYVFDQQSDFMALSPFITKQKPGENLSAKANSYAILRTGTKEVDLQLAVVLNSQLKQDEAIKRLKLPVAVSGGILFNYYLRTNVRHLINELRIPASDNFYCINPLDPRDLQVHWFLANSKQYLKLLMKASRPQGSGLRKLQLYEYCSVPFPNYKSFCVADYTSLSLEASKAIFENWTIEQVREVSSEILGNILSRDV